MHFSSLDNMRRCITNHLLADPVLGDGRRCRVLDVGGADVNGSYRSLFTRAGCDYTSADLDDGPTVDVVLTSPDVLPFADGEFDVVVSGNTFEHAPDFWVLFAEMVRVCADHGALFVLAPSSVGFIHRYPVDCYRFLPDSYQALADRVGVTLADCWRDERGPFNELVGVFVKQPRSHAARTAGGVPLLLEEAAASAASADALAGPEQAAGAMPTLEFQRRVHDALTPRFHLSVGVGDGAGLALADCPSLGVDISCDLDAPLRPGHSLFRGLSQDFFTAPEASALGPVDLAHVHGNGRLGQTLLDLMYVERHSHPGSVILVDGIYPDQGASRLPPIQGASDVWKLVLILRVGRPDLILLPLDTAPGGTLLIVGADAANTVLWDGFDFIVADAHETSDVPPPHVGRRSNALAPDDPLVTKVLHRVRSTRGTDDASRTIDSIRRLVAGAFPRTIAGAR